MKRRRKPIELAFVGDNDTSFVETKKAVVKALTKIFENSNFRIKSLATLKQDSVGLYARNWCRKNAPKVELRTVKIKAYQDKKVAADLRNLYEENSVGALIWKADRFVIFWSGYKNNTATSAIEQVRRLEHLGKRAKIIEL